MMGSPTTANIGHRNYWMSSSIIVRVVVLFFVLFVTTAASAEEQTIGRNGEAEAVEACVTLVEYNNRQCTGQPIGNKQFTTSTGPGSPCKHTEAMGKNSAKDQYCILDGDDDNNTFKQTVYISSTNCKVPVWEKAISPMHLTYEHNKCTYGYKLGSCESGPCNNGGGSEENNITIDDGNINIQSDSFSQLRRSS